MPVHGVLLQTAAVTATMGASMAKANEAMAAIGKTNDPAKVAATLQQFSKESAQMDMGQEMMDDALDNAFDTEGTEDETDDIMNQARPCTDGSPSWRMVLAIGPPVCTIM